eukprot:3426298-Rhodomonas_salina.1
MRQGTDKGHRAVERAVQIMRRQARQYLQRKLNDELNRGMDETPIGTILYDLKVRPTDVLFVVEEGGSDGSQTLAWLSQGSIVG